MNSDISFYGFSNVSKNTAMDFFDSISEGLITTLGKENINKLRSDIILNSTVFHPEDSKIDAKYIEKSNYLLEKIDHLGASRINPSNYKPSKIQKHKDWMDDVNEHMIKKEFHGPLSEFSRAARRSTKAKELAGMTLLLAEQGDANAQLFMGSLGKNDKEQLFWLNKAAMNGNLNALFCLSQFKKFYKANQELAEHYLNLAAENGHTEALITQGDKLRKNEYLKAALSCYEKAAKLGNKQSELFKKIGKCYEQQGDIRSAIRAYSKINYPWMLAKLGDSFREKGDLSTAVSFYKKAAKLALDNDELFVEIGDIYQEMKDFKFAIRAYNKIEDPELRQAKMDEITPWEEL